MIDKSKDFVRKKFRWGICTSAGFALIWAYSSALVGFITGADSFRAGLNPETPLNMPMDKGIVRVTTCPCQSGHGLIDQGKLIPGAACLLWYGIKVYIIFCWIVYRVVHISSMSTIRTLNQCSKELREQLVFVKTISELNSLMKKFVEYVVCTHVRLLQYSKTLDFNCATYYIMMDSQGCSLEKHLGVFYIDFNQIFFHFSLLWQKCIYFGGLNTNPQNTPMSTALHMSDELCETFLAYTGHCIHRRTFKCLWGLLCKYSIIKLTNIT